MSGLTYKEISEQAAALSAARDTLDSSRAWLDAYIGNQDVDEVVFVGSGSSLYQSMVMAATYRQWMKRPAVAIASSEIYLFRDTNAVPNRRYLFVGVSRSGESTEVLLALDSVGSLPNWTTCGITCYQDSSLGQRTECLVSPLGQEESTVMTKSFSSMTWMMQRAIAIVAKDQRAVEALDAVAADIESVVQSSAALADTIVNSETFHNYVYLGMGAYFGLAQEAMLKLKEMSNVWVESYGTLEFRHGPKSIVEPGSLIIVLLSERARSFELKVAEEMKAYGATVVLVTAQDGPDTAFADYVFNVGAASISDEARSVLYLPLVQFIGCLTAQKRGLNPDTPRNLTQVVTL